MPTEPALVPAALAVQLSHGHAVSDESHHACDRMPCHALCDRCAVVQWSWCLAYQTMQEAELCSSLKVPIIVHLLIVTG